MSFGAAAAGATEAAATAAANVRIEAPRLPPPTHHPPQIPLLPDATRRLAAVDLDWDHVRAVDILAVLRSFVPQGGAIQRVVVYPSGALGRGGGTNRQAVAPFLALCRWRGACRLLGQATASCTQLLCSCPKTLSSVLAHACTSCSTALFLAC